MTDKTDPRWDVLDDALLAAMLTCDGGTVRDQ